MKHAMTFWVVLDTPWRFNTVRKLWTYAGLGLERNKSGLPKAGKPNSNGPQHLNRQYNRRLKNVAKGVATTVIGMGNNPFAQVFERLVAQGTSPSNAIQGEFCVRSSRSINRWACGWPFVRGATRP